MSILVAETIGTMMLVLLGCGVCANVSLTGTKGRGSGWLMINIGWGFAVAVSVYLVNPYSGGHLNPAVTLGNAAIENIPWADVPLYLAGQFVGALIGSVLVWLAYMPHWKLTEDQSTKLGVFATAPAVRNPVANLVTEIIATFVLVLGVLAILSPENLVPDSGFDTGMAPFLVGVLVWAIGMSLGGSTGYAINPARDLGPRIAHAVLPIPDKGDSDWSYAWIPVVGPVVGGVLGALFFRACWPEFVS